MEPEGSSPCSQEPSTGPSLEPDQSSLFHPILQLSLPGGLFFLLAFPPIYAFLLSPMHAT
jgi:hypothetical protein